MSAILKASPLGDNDLYMRTKSLGEVPGPKCVTLCTSITGHELTHAWR